jgi:hypothetical protein
MGEGKKRLSEDTDPVTCLFCSPMDTRLPSLAELQNPVVDPLEDVKALIVAEVKAQRTKKIVLTVPRVLTQNEIHTLS